ncbi:Ribonuclease 3-like protein 2 [Ananas comosus]|uniref:Ribonuclease 3-like protein 2 n=1 Tax=Ananas comosus TaxID=4615 RepID=A0A199W314_ANACO|nr:Ribonuclease 3-like protein 2 [Ananas comosus]
MEMNPLPLLVGPGLGDDEDDEEMSAAVARVERLLGYGFRDRRLLREALTHPSAAAESGRSYQRLEFVGDAALGLAFSNYLYLTNPDVGPGSLSVLRAANISTEKLARVAVRHRLYPLLRRNSPRLDQLVTRLLPPHYTKSQFFHLFISNSGAVISSPPPPHPIQVSQFTEAVLQEPEDDLVGLLYGGSTVKAPKVLADIVEAIAAAVYVDSNFHLEMLWKVIRGIMEPIITAETVDEQPVTTLHELCQKYKKNAMFKHWRRDNTNVVNVFVDGDLVGIGSSEQKMIAKLNAARDALHNLANSKSDLLTRAQVGSEAGEHREAKQKLNELCSKKRWRNPKYK